MKKETLKDWVRNWTVEQIAGGLTSLGMEFMAMAISEDELKKERNVYTRELNRRIKNK